LARKSTKPKPKLKAKTKGQAKAKRQAKKHQAKHQALRLKVWLGPFARAWAKVPNKVRVPGMTHDVEKDYVAVFVVVLILALGGGYLGAKALFGKASDPQMAQGVLIQQSLDGIDVILPEPNGNTQHGARAYEEKVADEVYVPKEPIVEAVAPDVEVAKLTPPTQKIGPQPVWMQNAIDYTPVSGKPMIAIVIDDMGVDRKRSKHMWEDVPGPLTLSFMTYANDLPQQTHAARAKGHELMLHVSMEPSNSTIDAGPNVLLTGMPDEELTKLINWGMDRFEGFVGVNNHMGSRFTEDPHAMKVVLEQVKKRGFLFLDSRTSPKSIAGREARKLGMPTLVRNVFIDNDNEIDKVLKQLNEAERLARKRGVAIAIGHPREATIEVLKTWVPEALERGLAIVPISTVMLGRIAQQQKETPK